MKKSFIGLLVTVLSLMLAFPIFPVYAEEKRRPTQNNTGQIGDGTRNYRIGGFNRLIMQEVTAPTGNPTSNSGWLYVKDLAGASALYFEDDAGTVTNLGAAATPSWSDLTAPTAAKTIAFGTFASAFTSAKTDGDMFTFTGIGAFGDYSVVKITNTTGNPTDGTLLTLTSTDTDVDALLTTANSIDVLKVNGAGTLTIAGNTTITGKILGASPLLLEGTTTDGTNVVTVAVTYPTAARTLTIPDASGTVALLATATHTYATAHATWTLTVAEERASYITMTAADAGAIAQLSAAIPGKCYFLNNASGQIITFKVSGQTGGTIANAKRAYYCSDAVDLYEVWEQS